VVLAARPDATLVVQADNSPSDDGALEVTPAALEQMLSNSMAVVSTHAGSLSRPQRISSYLNPIELYTRTQRGLEDASRTALLDVLA
jgi:hypothetical protein